jgi:hypothetical protein
VGTQAESRVLALTVEGDLDEGVASRLAADAGFVPGAIYGKKGKQFVRAKIGSYNSAARYRPWFVLVDLDLGDCAPALVSDWLPAPAPLMLLRVAVREVESWLLADRETIAGFLGVRLAAVPLDPESLPDPKRTLVELARRSRRRALVEDLVPREAGGRVVGPAYSSRLREYVESAWRPDVAASHAPSLERCMRRLRELRGRP